jgi:hypothetical protein
MPELERLIEQVSRITNVQCRPASEDDLEVLRDLEVPEKVVEFFARYEPAETMEYGPSVYPISAIEELCNNGSTAEAAFDAGLIPFGDLICGDTLCFDPTNLDEEGWPAIVRVSHETVSEESTKEEVLAGTEPYCPSLPALLEMMIENDARKRAIAPTLPGRPTAEWSARMAAADAKITDRKCPHCGQPCPSYRKTCKHCRQAVNTA